MSCERKPTSEELNKIENYFKEYAKLHRKSSSSLYNESVVIPFAEFFENTNEKFHITTVYVNDNLRHVIQTDESFIEKVEESKKHFLPNCRKTIMQFHVSKLRNKEDLKHIVSYTFNLMNRKYCNAIDNQNLK